MPQHPNMQDRSVIIEEIKTNQPNVVVRVTLSHKQRRAYYLRAAVLEVNPSTPNFETWNFGEAAFGDVEPAQRFSRSRFLELAAGVKSSAVYREIVTKAFATRKGLRPA